MCTRWASSPALTSLLCGRGAPVAWPCAGPPRFCWCGVPVRREPCRLYVFGQAVAERGPRRTVRPETCSRHLCQYGVRIRKGRQGRPLQDGIRILSRSRSSASFNRPCFAAQPQLLRYPRSSINH